MGRKRNRTWKYLHLSIVCIIFISTAGCAALKELKAKREARGCLFTAQRLLNQGDYDGSLQENQKVLSLYGNVPPGDQALFNIGVIYAHYEYPKRDYQKSLDHLKRLVNLFPRSPFSGQAKIWIGILQENERLRTETDESNRSIKKLQQENERSKREIEELNKTIEKSKQVDLEIDQKRRRF